MVTDPNLLGARVLIVDDSDDSRAVLRSALEHRGMRVEEAAAADRGLRLARRLPPDLVVLDTESLPDDSRDLRNTWKRETRRNNTPIVVIGQRQSEADRFGTGQFVSKPYHYAPLIHRIEGILGSCFGINGSGRAASHFVPACERRGSAQ